MSDLGERCSDSLRELAAFGHDVRRRFLPAGTIVAIKEGEAVSDRRPLFFLLVVGAPRRMFRNERAAQAASAEVRA